MQCKNEFVAAFIAKSKTWILLLATLAATKMLQTWSFQRVNVRAACIATKLEGRLCEKLSGVKLRRDKSHFINNLFGVFTCFYFEKDIRVYQTR